MRCVYAVKPLRRLHAFDRITCEFRSHPAEFPASRGKFRRKEWRLPFILNLFSDAVSWERRSPALILGFPAAVLGSRARMTGTPPEMLPSERYHCRFYIDACEEEEEEMTFEWAVRFNIEHRTRYDVTVISRSLRWLEWSYSSSVTT